MPSEGESGILGTLLELRREGLGLEGLRALLFSAVTRWPQASP